MSQPLVLFEEACFERLWGGNRLATSLGMNAPAHRPVGEAWLVSDHPVHESRVANGAWAGKTLHQVLEEEPEYLLGSVARPTIHGRFPLLLKVLDAAQVLSVQVHPDDEAARTLGEPDVGKTEMWHVLESAPGSELICGLDPALDREGFLQAARAGDISKHLERFPAPAGTNCFVAAGTVHAIGAGILLAEIQQNSDLTYRIHDWDRVDAAGNPRALHLEKAAQVTHFGVAHGGAAQPLTYGSDNGAVTVLGACRYFAAERVQVDGVCERPTRGQSFHLLLALDAGIGLASGTMQQSLQRCQAVLIPAGADGYTLTGAGAVLDYYVPDLAVDIVQPLRQAGHSDAAIVALGGAGAVSDLAPIQDV